VTYLILTVDEITGRIGAVFLGDPFFQNLAVRGEILELVRHGSGNVFFALGGKESRISCVLFKSDALRIPLWPRAGDEVIVEGRVAVYAQRGTYQIYARRLAPVGAGAVARAREELRNRLLEEGVFSPELKRPLPPFPERVAVVTSASGAAVHDVIRVAGNRFRACEIVVIPVTVQGYEAAQSIVDGLSRANLVDRAEAVLLVRGGGSRDDLNPFDDESVVRAVRMSRLPLITGLGHDIDLSLSDLAADVSAPTPSAAAEYLFPDSAELAVSIRRSARLARSHILRVFSEHRFAVSRISQRLADACDACIRRHGFALESRMSKLEAGIRAILNAQSSRFSIFEARLHSLSPTDVLRRGYCVCETKNGLRLRSVSEIPEEDVFVVRFSDGDVCVTAQRRSP
jgi:exodeoxyribonuclease VII large subunit